MWLWAAIRLMHWNTEMECSEWFGKSVNSFVPNSVSYSDAWSSQFSITILLGKFPCCTRSKSAIYMALLLSSLSLYHSSFFLECRRFAFKWRSNVRRGKKQFCRFEEDLVSKKLWEVLIAAFCIEEARPWIFFRVASFVFVIRLMFPRCFCLLKDVPCLSRN